MMSSKDRKSGFAYDARNVAMPGGVINSPHMIAIDIRGAH